MIDFNTIANNASTAKASKEVAAMYHDVFTAFMEQGFLVDYALDLTKHFVGTMLLLNSQEKNR